MNRCIVILGGTGGMGIAVVRKFFEKETCDITTISMNRKEIDAARKEFENPNGTFTAYYADVTNTAEIKKIYQEVAQKYGKIDCLINAVGTLISGTIEDMDEQSFKQMLNVNLIGVFIALKEAIPYLMRSGNAYVVNVSSLSSVVGGSSVGYSVAKAGVDMLSKDAARDLAKHNIRVNTVNPGMVNTGFQVNNATMDRNAYETMLAEVGESYPLGIGQPEDIAGPVYFLCTDEARWISGCKVFIDGGKLANSNKLQPKK